jgi:hypothetical protein
VSVRLNPGSCSLSLTLAVMCVAMSSSFAQSVPSPTRIVEEGIAVEFATEGTVSQGQARSGDDVRFRFRVSDTASGNPLQGLKPAAWLDLHRAGPAF